METKLPKSKPEAKPSTAYFSKSQLISSKKYQSRKDALSVLLDDNKSYSFEETDKILNDFMKGMVK